jgi:hypothetical protein
VHPGLFKDLEQSRSSLSSASPDLDIRSPGLNKKPYLSQVLLDRILTGAKKQKVWEEQLSKF